MREDTSMVIHTPTCSPPRRYPMALTSTAGAGFLSMTLRVTNEYHESGT
jgi:hypothetical protein